MDNNMSAMAEDLRDEKLLPACVFDNLIYHAYFRFMINSFKINLI